MPQDPNWAVVATVREPAALTLAFAAHHLALGAAEVWMFLDDPHDPAAEALRRLPRTRVVPCDAAHWAALGKRPDLQTARQRRNATLAAERSEADWLLHADADEFLWLGRPLAQDLARLGPEHGWLKLTVAERVWIGGQPRSRLFDGAFRTALDPETGLPDKVYGAQAPLLDRGLAGHHVGKALTRLGRGYSIGVHHPVLPDTDTAPPSRQAWHARILHFDGLTPAHWTHKSARYAGQGGATMERLLHGARRAQIEAIRAAGGGTEAALALHARLFDLSLDQAADLDAAEALIYAHLAPEEALASLLDGPPPDLSPAAFDAALAQARG